MSDLEQRLAQKLSKLRAKICSKTHTKINALSSHSFLQADDSYTESELDLTQRRRFILREVDWYSTKKSFPPILNLCSKHRAEDLF